MNVSRSELSKALKKVNVAVSTNNILPVYEQVLFESDGSKLTLTVLSSENMMQASIPIEKGEKESFSMKAKQILELVEKLSGDTVEIKRDKDSVKVKSGKFRATYDTFSVDDFPQRLTMGASAVKFAFKTKDFIEAVKYTSFCCSSEQHNPALKSVFMDVGNEKCTFVATDGKRMSIYNMIGKYDCSVKILVSNLGNILRSAFSEFETLNISIDESKMSISTDNVSYITTLSNAKYPAYEKVVPNDSEYKKFDVKKSDLQNAIDLITIRDSATPDVVLSLDKNSLTLSKIEDKNVVSENQIECKYEGDKMDICLSSDFIKQLLRVYDKDEMCFKIKNESSPVIIPDETFKHIIMPLKVNK